MQKHVERAISSGEDEIIVKLDSGCYVAKKRHLVLSGIQAENVSISFLGDNTIVIPEGKEYREGDLYQGDFSVNNSWMNGDNDLDNWSQIRFANGLVEVLDVNRKYCRIKSKESFPGNPDCSNAYILIPHWYRSGVYKINKIEGNNIYFTVEDLSASTIRGYNINDDYNYGRSGIRYKLCNIETGEDILRVINGKVRLPKGIDYVREGTAGRYFVFYNCTFSSIDIEGITIHGSSVIDSYPAIYIRNSVCDKFLIHDCEFIGMRGRVISITDSPNVSIENNLFSDCYIDCIRSGNGSIKTVVRNNRFERMGKRMDNSFCVMCKGTDFLVSENVFLDFGYSSISTGVWYKSTKNNPCSGVIDHNDLSYSDDYIADIDNYATMDSGAIYVQTKNDNVIIKNNYIHGYSGMGSNRGIFCDDGAFNVQIYGNVVLGIVNSSSIESRRVASVEKSRTPESGIERSNINVVISDNVVDRRIRFVGNEKRDNGCVKGRNYYLVYPGKIRPLPIYQNFSEKQKDVYIDVNAVTTDGRIKVSSSSRHALSHSSAWPILRSILTP